MLPESSRGDKRGMFAAGGDKVDAGISADPWPQTSVNVGAGRLDY